MDINLTLIGQIGTFLVFWWFTYKVVWPLFANVAEERRKKIANGLSMADRAKHSIFSAEEESRELIAQARDKATNIVNQAHKQADQMVAEARDEAQQAGKRELDSARNEIEHEVQKAREELRTKMSELIIQGAEQVIEREVNADDHARLIKELSEKL